MVLSCNICHCICCLVTKYVFSSCIALFSFHHTLYQVCHLFIDRYQLRVMNYGCQQLQALLATTSRLCHPSPIPLNRHFPYHCFQCILVSTSTVLLFLLLITTNILQSCLCPSQCQQLTFHVFRLLACPVIFNDHAQSIEMHYSVIAPPAVLTASLFLVFPAVYLFSLSSFSVHLLFVWFCWVVFVDQPCARCRQGFPFFQTVVDQQQCKRFVTCSTILELSLCRASYTGNVFFTFLHAFAPHTRSKKVLKKRKKALFSLSDVAVQVYKILQNWWILLHMFWNHHWLRPGQFWSQLLHLYSISGSTLYSNISRMSTEKGNDFRLLDF